MTRRRTPVEILSDRLSQIPDDPTMRRVYEIHDTPGTVDEFAEIDDYVDRVTYALDSDTDARIVVVEPWLAVLLDTDTDVEVAVVAAMLAELGDDVPHALAKLAESYLHPPYLYRVNRPRARKTDPATSTEAAERIKPTLRRSGGVVHRILNAYAGPRPDAYRRSLTAREIEDTVRIRAAHKRTSELVDDGLLEVVQRNGEDLTYRGGRVLAITPAGIEELRRMDEADRA